MSKTLIPDMLGRRRLARFERAAVSLAFKGSAHPEDHYGIEREYERARELMLQHFDAQALTIRNLSERLIAAKDKRHA